MQVDDVCLEAFAVTECNKMFVGISLHRGVKIIILMQLDIMCSRLTCAQLQNVLGHQSEFNTTILAIADVG
jgi:hypothetical protein